MNPSVAATVEAFVTELVDDDQPACSFSEAERLAEDLQVHVSVVVREIRSYGIEMTREVPKRVRGYRTSSQDRYFGPGCSKTHGGSGYEQITGFGGREG